MPIKLNHIMGSIRQRLERLRETIPDGEGLTMVEAGERIKATDEGVRQVCHKHRWSVFSYSEASGKMVGLLVNPRMLKKYGKTRTKT